MGGLIAQYNSNTSAGTGAAAGIFFLFAIAAYVFYSYCLGLIFRKAGQPLWAGFVPLYNTYIVLKIIGRPGWWLILFFIPIVNIVIGIIVYFDLAKSFGKGVGFGLGLFFLSFIFIPILAFSDAQYLGPTAALGYPPPPGYPPPGYPPPHGYPPPPESPPQGGGQWDASK
jgi:hypothetical protein